MSCGNVTKPFYKAITEFDFKGRNKIGCWGGNLTQKGNILTCIYEDDNAGLNVEGLIGVIVFYLVILGVGLYAAWKNHKPDEDATAEDVILAKRNINLFVGVMTMTATWVGGGYINGAAEITYGSGFGWCQAPFGFSISLMLGGLLFAKPMRDAGYTTMLDPFQERFGRVMGAICFLPALTGELFWSAAILSALGSTLSVILHVERNSAVIVSSIIAIGYTLCGGLLSVAYTDVVQLIMIGIGLVLACPFAANHAFAFSIGETDGPCFDPPLQISDTVGPQNTGWVGHIASDRWGVWVDVYLLLIFGGIPWQVYFQRVLSSKDAKTAQFLSFSAGIGCILLALPPAFIGAIAFSTDWTKVLTLPKSFNVTYDYVTSETWTDIKGSYLKVGVVNDSVIMPINSLKDSSVTLPLVLQYLTPKAVSVIGLGAVAAAVMSSTDSSILGVSSMFTNNIYKVLFRPKASEKELIWVIRGAVVVVGGLALILGLSVQSVYGLFYLCADFVYVILFPQLVAVIYIPFVNVYGSIVGYVIGLVLRLIGGERVKIGNEIKMDMDPWVGYPFYTPYDENGVYQGAAGQLFPFRTFAMIMSFVSLILISILTHYLFVIKDLKKWDFLKVFKDDPTETVNLNHLDKYQDKGENNYALETRRT